MVVSENNADTEEAPRRCAHVVFATSYPIKARATLAATANVKYLGEFVQIKAESSSKGNENEKSNLAYGSVRGQCLTCHSDEL